MKVTATLEHWWHEPQMFNVIWGQIHYDIHDRWPEGTLIRTSSLKHPSEQVHKEGDIVTTRNSFYKLGRPRVFSDGI